MKRFNLKKARQLLRQAGIPTDRLGWTSGAQSSPLDLLMGRIMDLDGYINQEGETE